SDAFPTRRSSDLELAVCLTVVLTEPDGFLTLRLKDSPERQSSVSLEQVFRRALPKSGQVIVSVPLQGGAPDVPTVQLAAEADGCAEFRQLLDVLVCLTCQVVQELIDRADLTLKLLYRPSVREKFV